MTWRIRPSTSSGGTFQDRGTSGASRSASRRSSLRAGVVAGPLLGGREPAGDRHQVGRVGRRTAARPVRGGRRGPAAPAAGAGAGRWASAGGSAGPRSSGSRGPPGPASPSAGSRRTPRPARRTSASSVAVAVAVRDEFARPSRRGRGRPSATGRPGLDELRGRGPGRGAATARGSPVEQPDEAEEGQGEPEEEAFHRNPILIGPGRIASASGRTGRDRLTRLFASGVAILGRQAVRRCGAGHGVRPLSPIVSSGDPPARASPRGRRSGRRRRRARSRG